MTSPLEKPDPTGKDFTRNIHIAGASHKPGAKGQPLYIKVNRANGTAKIVDNRKDASTTTAIKTFLMDKKIQPLWRCKVNEGQDMRKAVELLKKRPQLKEGKAKKTDSVATRNFDQSPAIKRAPVDPFVVAQAAFKRQTAGKTPLQIPENTNLSWREIDPSGMSKISFIFIRSQEGIKPYRRLKKLAGRGGEKNVFLLEDERGRREWVRMVPRKDRAKGLGSGSIKATKVSEFRKSEYLCTGRYLTYTSKKPPYNTKAMILAPYRDTDMFCLVSSKAIPTKAILFGMLQAAKGLQVMHSKNWIHGDLKLSNLLCDINTLIPFDPADPEKTIHVQVGDFGFAKEVGEGDVIKNRGTPFAKAPELYKNAQGPEAGKKVDIYAFGIALWEAWKGESCKWNTSDTHKGNYTRKQQAKKGFPEPKDKEGLEYLIWEMCNPDDPSQRPTIEEVISRLETLLGSTVTPAGPASKGRRHGLRTPKFRFFRRRQ